MLGLLGPRVALLLFWYFRRRAAKLNEVCGNSSSKDDNSMNALSPVIISRCCALMTVDALGAALPSTIFFQVCSHLSECLSHHFRAVHSSCVRVCPFVMWASARISISLLSLVLSEYSPCLVPLMCSGCCSSFPPCSTTVQMGHSSFHGVAFVAASDSRTPLLCKPLRVVYRWLTGVFSQAYLGLLDGISGPAGRSGEALLLNDLILGGVVLLPVLLLSATLLPPLCHWLSLCQRENSGEKSTPPGPSRRLFGALKRRYMLWGAATAILCIACVFGTDLWRPSLQQPQQRGVSMEAAKVMRVGTSEEVLPIQQKTEESVWQQDYQGLLLRLLHGLLPTNAWRYWVSAGLLPSAAYPFSPERPLQLHFVTFRRSKVIAKISSAPSTTDRGDQSHDGLDDGNAATATSHIDFGSDLAPLVSSYPSAHLMRHSTQGVAVVGLGGRTLWNPAAKSVDGVLTAIRNAVYSAEAAVSDSNPSHSSSCSREGAVVAASQQHVGVEEKAFATSGVPAKTSADGDSAMVKNCKADDGDTESSSKLPAFQVKEEPASKEAPLTHAHLHRTSTRRSHWSVYTDAKVRKQSHSQCNSLACICSFGLSQLSGVWPGPCELRGITGRLQVPLIVELNLVGRAMCFYD